MDKFGSAVSLDITPDFSLNDYINISGSAAPTFSGGLRTFLALEATFPDRRWLNLERLWVNLGRRTQFWSATSVAQFGMSAA